MAVSRRYRQRSPQSGNFDQNDGVAGVVYILRNDAFKEHWLKIGQSRHSGHVRAREMNRTASTGLPAHHVCVFECRTLDCGNAEKMVFQQLRHHRRGRQEFFEVDIEVAKAVIVQVCSEVDAGVRRTIAQQEQEARDAAAQREAAARRSNEEFLNEAAERRRRAAEQVRQGEFEHARRARGAQAAEPPPVMVDMTCPSCSLILTIPRSAAGNSTQKLRCKNCSAVFLPDGRLLSVDGAAAPHDSNFTTNYIQEPPPRPAPRTSLLPLDAVVAASVLAFACIIVATNWDSKPQNPLPSTTKPSVPATPPVAQPKTQQQLMDEAANEVAVRYPYLKTKAGARAVDLIIRRRDELIATGVSPESALRLAAMEIAPQHQPRQ